MMREGTAARTGSQIDLAVAGMGGDLNVTVDDDQTQVGGAVMSERGPEMVALVAEVLRTPRFPESELARVIATKVREVAIERSQPLYLLAAPGGIG